MHFRVPHSLLPNSLGCHVQTFGLTNISFCWIALKSQKLLPQIQSQLDVEGGKEGRWKGSSRWTTCVYLGLELNRMRLDSHVSSPQSHIQEGSGFFFLNEPINQLSGWRKLNSLYHIVSLSLPAFCILPPMPHPPSKDEMLEGSWDRRKVLQAMECPALFSSTICLPRRKTTQCPCVWETLVSTCGCLSLIMFDLALSFGST